MVATDLVYVVDDDPGMRETLVEILELAGIEAQGFESGAAVLAADDCARPALALLDHRLPDTTGIKLANQLKALDRDLAVVLLTGYTSAETAIAAVGQVDEYLTKPVAPDALIKSVRAGLERTRLRRDNRDLVARLQEVNSSLERTVVQRTAQLEEAHGQALLDQALQAGLRSDAERQRLENQLHQQERLQSLGQLAGGVAHDFNNLLFVILNCAALVAERTVDDEAISADVEQIRDAAARAARLTKQLLIVGRREIVHPETLDLNAIVMDIHSLLDRTLGEQIELTISASEDLPSVTADRGQLEQVLLNLAVNARDAMPAGGSLDITTTPVEIDDNSSYAIAGLAPGSYIELEVRDSGDGMSAEVVSHVFEPFFTTKAKGEGTGLGLSTVYGIVTEAGGHLHVDSTIGVGTTVRAVLPAADGRPTSARSEARAVAPVPGETILIVDDDPAVASLAGRLLRRNGYAVLEAATPAEALTLIPDHDVRLLLTDGVMPQMSGDELASRVQTMRPDISVLVMSGYGQLDNRVALEKCAMLIEKPFDENDLLRSVRLALDN